MYTHIYNNSTSIIENPISQPKNVVYSCNGLIELGERDFCYIDDETAGTLELVQNNVDSSNKKHLLFGYMNSSTSTTTGARMLRDAILRPLCHYEILEQRLDCVDYLIHRVDTLAVLTNCVRKYGQGVDLENVAPCLVHLFNTRNTNLQLAERRLDALSTLENLISQVSPLVAALEAADQPLLNAFKIALQDPSYNEILNDISNVIDSEAVFRKGRNREITLARKRSKICHIKHGVEALFDIACSTYNITLNELENYVRELNRDDGLSWKLNYSEGRGYYLTLNPNQLPKEHILGPQYLRVIKTRTSISCTTRDLMQLNVRANVSYENSMKLANEVLKTCLSNVINNIGAIYRLVEAIGGLDLITSFTKLVLNSQSKLVRPKFTSTETIISKARHPVLESVLSISKQTVVPNDVMLSTCRQNFMLVTGPNMGGKSVFLKQVGIIQIMAQLGSFVPAELAHIKLVNRIVARSGSNDDDNSSCSSFMWEMRGIASALKVDESVQEQSILYLIDEVGRGTSIDDGASYSFAIAEELALQRFNFTVFATHFDQVFTLASLYPNIAAYHFKYEEDDECSQNGERRQRLSHNLVPGVADKINYGIKLAETCGLPKEILDVAKTDAGYCI